MVDRAPGSSTTKSARAMHALSMNNLPASERSTQPSSPARRSGSSKPPTATTASPGAPGAREVARTRTPGQLRPSAPASAAHALIKCSQLSNRSSNLRVDNCAESVSSGSRPGVSRNTRARVTAPATNAGSDSPEKSTNTMQSSGVEPTPWQTTSIASRVLPQPPGPTRLTRRCSPSRLLTSSMVEARPTKLVSWAGTLSIGPV